MVHIVHSLLFEDPSEQVWILDFASYKLVSNLYHHGDVSQELANNLSKNFLLTVVYQ